MISTISDFALWADVAQWRDAGRQDLSEPRDLAAMTTDHIGPGSGVARSYFTIGDGFGFGYGFGIRTDPGNAVTAAARLARRIKWTAPPGSVVDTPGPHSSS
jgi:hypothetical protein